MIDCNSWLRRMPSRLCFALQNAEIIDLIGNSGPDHRMILARRFRPGQRSASGMTPSRALILRDRPVCVGAWPFAYRHSDRPSRGAIADSCDRKAATPGCPKVNVVLRQDALLPDAAQDAEISKIQPQVRTILATELYFFCAKLNKNRDESGKNRHNQSVVKVRRVSSQLRHRGQFCVQGPQGLS